MYVTYVYAYVYMHSYVYEHMYRGQKMDLDFQSPLSTLFETGSLCYLLLCTTRLCGSCVWEHSPVCLPSHCRSSWSADASCHTWLYMWNLNTGLHTYTESTLPRATSPLANTFFVQVGLEIMAHYQGWLRDWSPLEANTGPLTGPGQLGLAPSL